MRCIIEAELTPDRFAEIGEPYRIFNEPAMNLVALASQMPHLGFPGRWLHPENPPPSHRVGIYDERDGRLLGVIATKFPINDIAFSPDGESLLVATGSYDGGWCFMGYLLRYNWRTGRTEQMLGQCREVVACRYHNDDTITVLMRPENEEEFQDEGKDAWSIVLGLRIASGNGPWSGEPVELPREDARQVGLSPSTPSDHGFPDAILKQDPETRRSGYREAVEWLSSVRAERYCGIWDLQWMDGSTFAVTANGLAMEMRDLHGSVSNRIECEGRGVELIQHPCLGLLSHVQRQGPHGGTIDTTSELWQWQGSQLQQKLCFDRPHAFSIDSSGLGLAIDLSWGNQRDRRNLLLDRTGRTIANIDCGITDRIGPVAFPHGLEALYFLKRHGDETVRNDDYRVWRHQSAGRFACQRKWDHPERDFTPVTSVACSPGMVLGAGRVYNRTTHQMLGNFLELLEIATGLRMASIQLPCSPTRVAISENKRVAVLGLANGSVMFFDLESNEAIGDLHLSKNGLHSVPIALALRDDKLLIGTHDGRILLATFDFQLPSESLHAE